MPNAALAHDLASLAQVVLIDVALAGDNAVVVGLAASGLPERSRRTAVVLGILVATAVRIGLGLIALHLLQILGLLLAGGLLLLWVAWKMFRELRGLRAHNRAGSGQKTLGQAMLTIVLADVSMSLDNVLAVAGAASDSAWVLAVGLLLSVLLMGVAADYLARLLGRQRWIAWLGLAIVVFVAVRMIWEGSHQIATAASEGAVTWLASRAGSI